MKEFSERYVTNLKTKLAIALQDLEDETEFKLAHVETIAREREIYDRKISSALSEQALLRSQIHNLKKDNDLKARMLEYYRWTLEMIGAATVYRDETCNWISFQYKNNARHALARVFKEDDGNGEKNACAPAPR